MPITRGHYTNGSGESFQRYTTCFARPLNDAEYKTQLRIYRFWDRAVGGCSLRFLDSGQANTLTSPFFIPSCFTQSTLMHTLAHNSTTSLVASFLVLGCVTRSLITITERTGDVKFVHNVHAISRIGPHPTAMFEVNTFTPHQTGALFSFLTIYRGPCS